MRLISRGKTIPKGGQVRPDDPKQNTFDRSLEELTADDLAPKRKNEKRSAQAIVSLLFWILISAALFAVAVWASAKVVSNLVDFSASQKDYEEMSGEFSPIGKKTSKPRSLLPNKEIYPIADYSDLISGHVDYPSEDPTVTPYESTPTPVETPTVDPTETSGGQPTPSKTDLPTDTDFTPAPTPSEPEPTPTVVTPDPPVKKSRDLTSSDPLLSHEQYLAGRDSLAQMRSNYGNSDICGWINIPLPAEKGKALDYPVVRGEDNDYYLDHGPKKNRTAYGSIFMDFRNSTNLLNNQVTVIYGHNVRNDSTMFNRLLDYKYQKNFYNKNYRYVYIYTDEAVLQYEVFSVFEETSAEAPTNVVRYPSGSAFLQRMNEVKNKSLYQREGLELYENDRVLILYTCANSVYDARRWLVCAVLVGVGK